MIDISWKRVWMMEGMWWRMLHLVLLQLWMRLLYRGRRLLNDHLLLLFTDRLFLLLIGFNFD